MNLRGLGQISLVTCSDRLRLCGKPGMHNLVGGQTSFRKGYSKTVDAQCPFVLNRELQNEI